MYEAHLFPEVGYTFKHALTHEVAYGSLLQERRALTPASWRPSNEVMSADGPGADRLAEQADRLGHHALRGQRWEKAVRTCGGPANGRRPLGESPGATYFEQALEALNHLPNHRDTQELAIDIRLDLRNVLLPLNDLQSMFEHLQQAEAAAIALDDRRRLAWISAYLAPPTATPPSLAKQRGRPRAMAIADERADLPLQDDVPLLSRPGLRVRLPFS